MTAVDTGLPASSDARTISFWFRTTHSSSTKYFLGYGNNVNDQAIGLNINASGHAGMTNFGGQFNTSPTTVNDGKRHFLVFDQAGSVQHIYIDNVLRGTGALTVNTVLDELLFFDFIGGFGVFLACEMSDLAIFDEVLSTEKRTRLYLSDFKESPLGIASVVRYWPMDDGKPGDSANGDTVRELVGANDGTGNDGGDGGLVWTGEFAFRKPQGPIIIRSQEVIAPVSVELAAMSLNIGLDPVQIYGLGRRR